MKFNELKDFIKKFEGYRSRAYKCSAGVWTVAFGHVHNAFSGLTINREIAEKLLECDIMAIQTLMDKYIKIQLTDNEYAALTSFTFNVGVYNFKRSTLLKKLNKGDKNGAAKEFLKWTRSNGKILNGLVKRRKKEMTLFLEKQE